MMLKKLNEILSLFTAQRPELTALDVADRLSRPKSSVYRLLSSIAEEGFLDYDELTARYRVGIRLAALGDIAQRSTTLQRSVYPALVRLSADTKETATLMVRSGSQGTTVEMVESFQPVMLPGVLGEHPPLHASAGGKVLLAWLAPAQRHELLCPPLKRFTPATITELNRLFAELDRARERGYSTVRGEWVSDIFGVAAPVWNHAGALIGAITVGLPRARASTERLLMLRDAVIRAAGEASVASGFDIAQADPKLRAARSVGLGSGTSSGASTDRRKRVRSS